MLPPGSSSPLAAVNAAGRSGLTLAPRATSVGLISMERLRSMSRIPVSVAIWQRLQARSRLRVQGESCMSERPYIRARLSPQLCSSTPGYRSVAKGMRTSIDQPSGRIFPDVSKVPSHSLKLEPSTSIQSPW
jgi:hypothetical protein